LREPGKGVLGAVFPEKFLSDEIHSRGAIPDEERSHTRESLAKTNTERK